MKTKKKCLALLQGKGLQELSTKEITGIYGGITRTEAWVAGMTFACLLIGAKAVHMDFSGKLAEASATKQYTMNVELQPLSGSGNLLARNALVPFINDIPLDKYLMPNRYKRFEKYLEKDGSIKEMSTLKKLGHAVSEYKVGMLVLGIEGSILGLEISCFPLKQKNQQESTQTNEAKLSA